MSKDRWEMVQQFVEDAGWKDAHILPLAGDASNRRYFRMAGPPGLAVIMDAPPETGEDVRPFVRIAEYLSGIGLSAPRIYASDEAKGFLILEHLGDDLYARKLAVDLSPEQLLYDVATDALMHLHASAPPEGLESYDATRMAQLSALAYDWYLAESSGADPDARGAFVDVFEPVLAENLQCSVVILRDYHAENLLWLPDRTGAARAGLLDFQDAMMGDPAYDLVSMLMDARRDVSAEVEAAEIDRFVVKQGLDREQLLRRYHLCGAQRNLRIIGVFARLSRRDGKKHYVDLIPRVWGHLMRNLSHPALAPVAEQVLRDLPEPAPEVLERLRR
ncbi:aminoglycoside phosphotransferase family protein [Pseudooceanicola sp. C21-150M6]|uniref:aminoglycoside phosphotransferase family protein n=1 Tax=Pseudooceanicola sp. C21-150M6 TaxID=3434355 RepID=UPI003D7F39F9